MKTSWVAVRGSFAPSDGAMGRMSFANGPAFSRSTHRTPRRQGHRGRSTEASLSGRRHPGRRVPDRSTSAHQCLGGRSPRSGSTRKKAVGSSRSGLGASAIRPSGDGRSLRLPRGVGSATYGHGSISAGRPHRRPACVRRRRVTVDAVGASSHGSVAASRSPPAQRFAAAHLPDCRLSDSRSIRSLTRWWSEAAPRQPGLVELDSDEDVTGQAFRRP